MKLFFQKCDIATWIWANPALRGRSWFLAFCIGLMGSFGWSDALCAQSNSRLSPSDTPWLDSKAGEVLPVNFGDRQSARSTSRADVPDAVDPPALVTGPAAPARPWMNWNWPRIWTVLKVVSCVFLILIIGLGVYLGYRYYHRYRERNADDGFDERLSTRTIEQSMQQLSFDVDLSNGNFCDAAEKAYRSGDLKSAIIFWFSYVLVSLDQKGHIRLRKGKTNREYLREIRGERRLAKFYQRVMVPFEETFFGDYQLEQDEFENCWKQLGQFQKDIIEHSRVTHG